MIFMSENCIKFTETKNTMQCEFKQGLEVINQSGINESRDQSIHW